MTATKDAATFSELLNQPKDTVARLNETPRRALRITRRDGEDLYLTTADRAEEAVGVVNSTTRMFVAMMKSDPAAAALLTKVFPDAFPWVRFLPDDAVREFLVEFMDTARASTELGTIGPLGAVVSAWRATAEIYADPDLYAAATRTDGGDYGPVEPPEADSE